MDDNNLMVMGMVHMDSRRYRKSPILSLNRDKNTSLEGCMEDHRPRHQRREGEIQEDGMRAD